MKSKFYLKTFILLSCALILLTGCKKEGLKSYTGGNSVGFWIHTLNHSLYGMNSEELPKDTIVLDLALSGYTADYDRKVDGTFIPDAEGTTPDKLKNTAIEGIDYNILGGEIKAGKEYGKFYVEVINKDILETGELKLNLAIKENKEFTDGLSENKSIVITWSRIVMKPATWNAMRYFFCADYSTQVYKIFMQVTGLKQFYYYEGIISVNEANVMGRNFGNVIRQYEKEHGTPMLHDDGAKKGLPIIPLN